MKSDLPPTFAEKDLKVPMLLKQARRELKKDTETNTQLVKHVLQQFQQVRELVRTTVLITSTLDLDAVLEEVMDTVVDMTGAERAYLMLYDEEKKLQPRAARNWDRETLSTQDIGMSQSVINQALETNTPIITTNAQTDERFSDKASIMVQQLRSIVCIPLSLGGKSVGVLYADNRFQKGVFQEENIPILTAFGTQAAIAITNAQIFGEVKTNLEEAQRMIKELQIEVDEDKVGRQVTEITETSYFKELAEAARSLRERSQRQEPEEDD